MFSFAEEVGDVDTATAETYSGYQTLVDDTGMLTIDVPIEWADIDTAPLALDDGTQNPFIKASPSIADYDRAIRRRVWSSLPSDRRNRSTRPSPCSPR